MESRSIASDRATAAIKRGDGYVTQDAMRSGAVVRGLIKTECYGPIAISDPSALRHLCNKLGIVVPPTAYDGFIHKKFADRLIALAHKADMRDFERLASGGGLLWSDIAKNIVVNGGLDEIIDVAVGGSSQSATWYVILMDSTPTVAAGDTMASHVGWTEFTEFSETVRQTWTDASTGTGQRDNSAAVASHSINGTATSGGAGLCNNNTKSGTSGIFMSGVAYSGGDRAVQSGDTLEVTYTLSVADDAV